MRLLTFTTLYPNEAQPQHGIFVEQRLRQLLATQRVRASVLAPVPWFPSRSGAFGDYGRFARAPSSEIRHGVPVHHPRYVVIPKVGMNCAPSLLARGAGRAFGTLVAEHGCDVVDAHYFYPDGVAAAQLANRFNLPLVITARGSDINVIGEYQRARRKIVWAAEQSAAVVAVSHALKSQLVRIGVQEDRVHVLRNGVDTRFFTRCEDGRTALDLEGTVLLSVGKLVEDKGHGIVIRALASLPDVKLVIVGAGPMRCALERLARELGLAGRVRLVGQLSHHELRQYYSAADLLVLASAREGMPNVVLESLACGTPVVATDVGGTGEIVTVPEAGLLISERTPAAVADAVQRLLERRPQPAAVRRHAEAFTWDRTTSDLMTLFERVRKP